MSDDKEEIERQINFSHWGGRASGLEGAAINAKRRSGEEYSAGNDVQAELWRRVAAWLTDIAEDARKTQRNYEKKFAQI